MIVPDLNLLVYAYNAACEEHERARDWWETTLSGTETVGMPWAVLLGYLRVTTSRRVLRSPLPTPHALRHLRSWLTRPQVQVVRPGARHLDVLETLLAQAGVAGSLTTDAHLAALAIEQQAVLHSNDTDFARFVGLRWLNPLA